MNREIKTKKVGRQKKLTNPCPVIKGGDRIWMEELGMYYIFFYEIRNGRRVLGKDRIKEILDILL